MTTTIERPVLPTPTDTELAAEASRNLAAYKQPEGNLKVSLEDGRVLNLPRAAAILLRHLLTEMAQGNAVTLMPVHAELTTQEAADHLNVSRPYLISLLEAKRMPYHKTGTHRRIKFSDLEAYKKSIEAERSAAMDELAQQAQELGMGY